MSMVSDETEIKVLFYVSITGIFIIISTKRTDKRSLQNDYFAASLSVSLTNPFNNILLIPSSGFPIHLKFILFIHSAILFIR